MRGAKQLEPRISGSQSNASGKNEPKNPATSKVRFLFEVSSQPLSGSRMSYLANQPILILKEGSSRNRGKDAQRGNISAARIVSEVVKTTLGPRGMDKMMVDSLGDVTITSDGATVLDELDVQHPAAKMLVEVGKSLMDTELVNGVIIDKEVVHPGMPKRMEKARIALLDTALEIEKTEFSAEIKISNPQQMQSFLDEETKLMKDMVDKIAEAGASVVLCQKGIDEIAQSFMAKQGILAARRIKKSDIEKLSRATGGRIITNLEDMRASDLGGAGLVEERKIGDDKMIFVEDAKDPKSVSILIRAGLERMVDEAERSLKDALSVVIDVVKKNKIVAGGGAVETELAKRIRDYATKIGGREQLAVEAFADAMESIPRTLSENAGLDQVDILVALRAAHETKGLWSGVNVYTGEITDMMKEGVLEPVKVKEHAIGSAVEVASMILRIDDVIAAAKPPPMPKGQGPPPD